MTIGHEERTRAVIEQAKRRSETVRTEALPQEVRMVIDQMCATIRDHESRVVKLEAYINALLKEAKSTLRGAA